MTKSELQKRVNSIWHSRIDGLHAHFSQLEPGKLPENWFFKSQIKDPSFYQVHRNEIVSAIDSGKIFDDTDSPLQMPK